jgi:hypothetical protein
MSEPLTLVHLNLENMRSERLVRTSDGSEKGTVKVFISWSGTRSHAVAQALAVWTRKVIQSVDPWVSSDLERGVKWMAEMDKGLDSHSIGIVCVTPGNVRAAWLNFEAAVTVLDTTTNRLHVVLRRDSSCLLAVVVPD